MKELNASPGKLISIGYEGEDKVTKIVFRYDEDWLACGDGVFRIRVLRHGDTEAYNATEVIDNREAMTLTMTVTDIELSVKGHGEMQVVYIGSNFVKKSPIYRYNVSRAIDSEVVNPPSGSIINEILYDIGDLTELTTTNKDSLVEAINEINAKEGGGSVTVDDELSGISENPVQNKVVKQYVDNATANKVTKFTVTISQENSSYVADKTYQQIAYAYIGGNDVVAVYNSITYPLFTIYNNTLFFGISGLLLGDVMTSGFAIAQDNTVTPVNENIALSNELLNINTALDTKASTEVATQSTNGLMSSADKTKLDAVGSVVTVSGTTPTIMAQSGVRYVCGEVSTLDITPCVSGICDVVFTSGSTATVLTLPSTVKFPDGTFTPEANTTYEINIMDGIYGAVMAWT